jgi:class 3 adenylate cyclase
LRLEPTIVGVAEGGCGEAARSTAIVLFTDLVGSTELRSRLGEQAAEVVRRQHDRLVAGAIEANRGRLVKNLGDGVMATFMGASDALGGAAVLLEPFSRLGGTRGGLCG